MNIGRVLVKCERCGKTAHGDRAEIREWDWFKCYLPETVHYCPDCKKSAEARAMFARSRNKPNIGKSR